MHPSKEGSKANSAASSRQLFIRLIQEQEEEEEEEESKYKQYIYRIGSHTSASVFASISVASQVVFQKGKNDEASAT